MPRSPNSMWPSGSVLSSYKLTLLYLHRLHFLLCWFLCVRVLRILYNYTGTVYQSFATLSVQSSMRHSLSYWFGNRLPWQQYMLQSSKLFFISNIWLRIFNSSTEPSRRKNSFPLSERHEEDRIQSTLNNNHWQNTQYRVTTTDYSWNELNTFLCKYLTIHGPVIF